MQGRRRRWGLWGALLVGCGSDYQLTPTPCDDWCHAVQRGQCQLDLPHGCVIACEQAGGRPEPPCAAPYDAFIDCFATAPRDEFSCVGEKTYAEGSLCLDVAVVWVALGCGPVPPHFPTVVGGRSGSGGGSP